MNSRDADRGLTEAAIVLEIIGDIEGGETLNIRDLAGRRASKRSWVWAEIAEDEGPLA